MRLGLIGGTGLVQFDAHERLDEVGAELQRDDVLLVETPFGEVPLRCVSFLFKKKQCEIIFLQRHHGKTEHGCPPHAINHRANVHALAQSNVEAILSVCSVGAIHKSFPPGKVALASQYIDFTGVTTTFHHEDAVFTSVTAPFDESMNGTLEDALRKTQNFGTDERLRYTYWLTQGPQFETAAEIHAIELLGGDMVGMTMPREAKLSREVGIPYSALCISSNWAAGRDPSDEHRDLDHLLVSAQANQRLEPVWASIFSLFD